MEAAEYVKEHWEQRQVWNVLAAPKHQERLKHCTSYFLQGGTYCDVGCAYGHSTAIMAGHIGGLRRWTGVDFADTVAKVREFFPRLRALYVPSIDKLAAVVGQYDYVVCSEVIEHVEDDILLCQQLKAITRKRLVITTPAVNVSDPGHLRLYTESMLLDACPDSTVERRDRFYYLTWRPEA